MRTSRSRLPFVVSLSAVLAFSSFGAVSPSQRITLAWNPSVSSSVAGYNLYFGAASQDYTNIVDAGNATSIIVSNLDTGATYYFALTAYDDLGLESEFSAEISYTVPGSATLNIAVSPSDGVTLTGSAPDGYQYQVLRTDDLESWSAVGNVTADSGGTLQFNEAPGTNSGARCYRLLQTSP